MHPDHALGNSRRGHVGWRSTAGRPGQCILQFQRLVFFSYSWPCPRALWPPAISQDPIARTVDGGCYGVQRSSRPAPHSALTPSTGRPMRLPTMSELSQPKSRKLISSCKSDQSTTKKSPLKRIKRGTVAPSPWFDESQERGMASPGAVSPHVVTWVLDT